MKEVVDSEAGVQLPQIHLRLADASRGLVKQEQEQKVWTAIPSTLSDAVCACSDWRRHQCICLP